MKPTYALAALVLLAGCGTQHAGAEALDTSSPTGAPAIAPDLAGHQFDRPDADHVLVAGDAVDLALPTGRVRVTVWGPALKEVQGLVAHKPGTPHSYLATFTVVVKQLSGRGTVAPSDFRLLAIADQDEGGARRTTVATATTLVKRLVTTARGLTGTWTAPFVEGHGELLYTPPGATRPAALWDFRAES